MKVSPPSLQNHKTIASNLFGRLWKGVASTGLAQVINGLTPLVLVPLFLRAWGAEGYGLWLSLTAWVAFLKLMDLGGQSFIGNLLSEEYVQGDVSAFRQTLSEGVSLFVLLCSLAFGLWALLLTLPGIVPDTLGREGRLILLIMGAAFLFGIPGGVYISLYRATGLYYLSAMYGNVSRTAFLLACAALLWWGFSLTTYAWGHLAFEIIGTGVLIWYTGRRIPVWSRLRLSLKAAWAGRVHLGGSFSFWVIALAYTLNFQGCIIILGASAGSAAVALYATHRTLSGLVGYISVLVQGPLWPELTFLQAQEQKARLRRLSLLTIRIVVLFSGMAALFGWLCFPAVYSLWTGRHLDFHPTLLILLLVQGVLAAGWNTTSWPLLATNRHRPLALASLGNALLTVALAAGLAPRYGVLGVAAASLAGDVIFGATVYPGLLSRFLDIPVRTVYQAMVVPLASLTIPGLIIIWSATYLGGWQLMLLVGLVALFFAYPAIWLALGKGDMEWLWLRIQGWAQGRA